jgi:DMSO reductase anchor subunit
MHPAKSVILFTTASGAGYGLLALLGIFGALGGLPADPVLGASGLGLALGLITVGLLSSTFHLGRPERAWRALSQWRSSWLSREGVAALFTYLPAALLALGWVVFGNLSGVFAAAGWVTAIGALISVISTAMIYASLRAVPAWHNVFTLPGYLVYAAMTGALLLHVLARLFATGAADRVALLSVALAACGAVVKLGYWWQIGRARAISSSRTATGLLDHAQVRLVDPPHSETNYLLEEMGYRIARKHANKLRLITLVLGFGLPVSLSALALISPPFMSSVLAVAAVLSGLVGIGCERWLFFAEAKHVVTLYYGATAV